MTAFERVQGNAIYTPSELAEREQSAPPQDAGTVLYRDPAIMCEWVYRSDPPEPCEGLSWFAVERSDGASPVAALPDMDHARAEACEHHLAEVIDWMLGGDEKLHAIVTPRWWDDGPEDGQ